MTASHTLSTEDLTLGYGDRVVIEGLDLTLAAGRITVIVGATACGKSTLLRSMSRLLAPRAGRVVLDGREVHRTPAKELARTLGLLPQSPVTPEGITVLDLVGRGRHPHQRAFSRWTAKDDEAVAAALEAVDRHGAGPADRPAAARRTHHVPRHQPPDRGPRPAHRPQPDPRHHHRHGPARPQPRRPLRGRLIALASGGLHAAGPTAEVMTEDTVRTVYGMESRVIEDPVSGRPLVLPIGRHHTTATATATTTATVTEDSETRP